MPGPPLEGSPIAVNLIKRDRVRYVLLRAAVGAAKRIKFRRNLRMPLTGHRVLLVEDEAIIAFDIIGTIREAHGEVVAHAASLAAGLRLADTPNLSSAILDFRL